MARAKDVSLLSAEWINARIGNVVDRAILIMEEIIRDTVSSGYLFLESPTDADFMKKLTPEQKDQYGLAEVEEDVL